MRYVIFGAGGCGRDVHAPLSRTLRTIGEHHEIIFCDHAKAGGTVLGVPVISPIEIRSSDHVLLAINDGKVREGLEKSFNISKFIAQTSLVSDSSIIDSGALISDFVIIGPSSRVGRLFHANYYSYVAHDCVIGNYVTFGPSVRCNGNVRIDDYVYVGANASIRQGLSIGRNAVVGMGAVVVKDVPANAVVVGNPATILRQYPRLRQAI